MINDKPACRHYFVLFAWSCVWTVGFGVTMRTLSGHRLRVYIVGKSPLRGGTRLVRIWSEYYSVHIYILILHVLTSPLNLKLGRDLDYA
jgi:hypothetical protein